VLDIGADDRRGVLGAQGEGRVVAVDEGVHLLADDVGVGADAAGETGFLKIGVRISRVVRAENGAPRFHAVPDSVDGGKSRFLTL
jgi:hypothetical protein